MDILRLSREIPPRGLDSGSRDNSGCPKCKNLKNKFEVNIMTNKELIIKLEEMTLRYNEVSEQCDNWVACSETLAKKVEVLEGFVYELINAGDELSFDNSKFEIERWNDLVKRVKKVIK